MSELLVRKQGIRGGNWSARDKQGAIDIGYGVLGDLDKEILIDNYTGSGNTYTKREDPLVNLFDNGVCIYAGTLSHLFNTMKNKSNEKSN